MLHIQQDNFWGHIWFFRRQRDIRELIGDTLVHRVIRSLPGQFQGNFEFNFRNDFL